MYDKPDNFIARFFLFFLVSVCLNICVVVVGYLKPNWKYQIQERRVQRIRMTQTLRFCWWLHSSFMLLSLHNHKQKHIETGIICLLLPWRSAEIKKREAKKKRIVRFIIHDLIEGWTRERIHTHTHSHIITMRTPTHSHTRVKWFPRMCKQKLKRISHNKCARIRVEWISNEKVRQKKSQMEERQWKKECKVRMLYWLNIKKASKKQVRKETRKCKNNKRGHTCGNDTQFFPPQLLRRDRRQTQSQSQRSQDEDTWGVAAARVFGFLISFFLKARFETVHYLF